jgi:hypothetical protein
VFRLDTWYLQRETNLSVAGPGRDKRCTTACDGRDASFGTGTPACGGLVSADQLPMNTTSDLGEPRRWAHADPCLGSTPVESVVLSNGLPFAAAPALERCGRNVSGSVPGRGRSESMEVVVPFLLGPTYVNVTASLPIVQSFTYSLLPTSEGRWAVGETTAGALYGALAFGGRPARAPTDGRCRPSAQTYSWSG